MGVCTTSLCQESYLIEKKIIKENKDIKEKNNKSYKKPVKKKESQTKAISNNKKSKKLESFKDNVILREQNELRIIYKPNQSNLNQKEVLKIIELTNKLNKESLVTLKSYASKAKVQGSSEARRLSLSRALEVRSLFIENGFTATNIIVKALGTDKNKEDFTDILIILIN